MGPSDEKRVESPNTCPSPRIVIRDPGKREPDLSFTSCIITLGVWGWNVPGLEAVIVHMYLLKENVVRNGEFCYDFFWKVKTTSKLFWDKQWKMVRLKWAVHEDFLHVERFFYQLETPPTYEIKKKNHIFDGPVCLVLCNLNTEHPTQRFCPTAHLESHPPSQKSCVITPGLTKTKKKHETFAPRHKWKCPDFRSCWPTKTWGGKKSEKVSYLRVLILWHTSDHRIIFWDVR